MELTQPTTSHKNLEQLGGTWSGTETCHPSPLNPEFSQAVGKFTNTAGLGGLHVVGAYQHEQDGTVAYEGHAVYSYDPDTKAYICLWFDGMAPCAQEFRGVWEEGVLTLTQVDTRKGHCRLIHDLREVDAGHYGFRMDRSEDGVDWSITIEGRYERSPN